MAIYLWCAILGVAIIITMWSFDKVIEIEFTEFHDNWIADGKPSGAGLSRKESRKAASFWTGGQTTASCWSTWLFETPGWAKDHARARNLLVRMRVAFAVAIVPSIGFFAYLLYLKRH